MQESNMKRLCLGGVAAAAVLLAGCADMSPRQQGTAQGAGIGALAGAVLSSATGGKAGTGAVIGGAVGAVAGNIWSKRQEDRRIALEQATRGTGVEVSRTADNQLKLNIPNDVSFDLNSAAIRPSMRNVLDPFASQLRDDPNARINIVGHTDSSGSDAVNDPLVGRARPQRARLPGDPRRGGQPMCRQPAAANVSRWPTTAPKKAAHATAGSRSICASPPAEAPAA